MPGLFRKRPGKKKKIPGSILVAARPFRTSCLIMMMVRMMRMMNMRMILTIIRIMRTKMKQMKMRMNLRMIKDEDDKGRG